MSAPTNPVDHRRHDRKDILFAARLMMGDANVDCEITNISFGGAQIRLRKPLTRGQNVVLDIDPFGKFAIEVRWFDNGEAGVKFKDDPAKVSELVMAIATYA
ncbi:MAG: PilZ domain-containing protein [Rhodospirillales bacterium]|jgi:hypothetical protein